MADDDAGGRILGFPGLTIPGPVGSGPPAPGAAAPSLTPLPTLAPPPSLMVAGSPAVGGGSSGSSGGNTVSVNADPGMQDNPQGAGITAMSVVMMAGIAVAAMRGAWNAATYLKARQEHHRAIADQARAAADKAALGVETARQKGRVQSGPEFGRNTRTAGGGGGRQNYGKSPTTGTFRSSGGPKPSGGTGSKKPSKTPGGSSGGRTGTLGSGGRGGGPKGRSGPLGSSGAKGGGKPGTGGTKTPTTGTKTPTTGTKGGSGSSLTGALRDRAAGRIRNGPSPKPGSGKSGTGTLGTSGKSGSGSTTGSSGSKSGRGSGSKTSTTGTGSGKGRTTLPAAVAKTAGRRLKKRRKKLSPPVLSTVRKGKGTKGGGKPGSGPGPKRKGKGRVTLPAAIVAESARRLKKRRKRLDPPVLSTVRKGKKKPTAAAPGTTPVSLTKKPKPMPGSGPAPKVNLTKKPKPTAGSGGGTGTGGTPPKVDLRKKVNLRKKTRRYGRPDGCFPGGGAKPTGPKGSGPKSTGPRGSGPKSSGPASGTGSRERWERAGSRRSERASGGPTGPTSPPGSTSSGPGPGAATGGPPPGWGHAQGSTYTVEQISRQEWEATRANKGGRPSSGAARGGGGLPTGTSKGGTAVTVPVPAKSPNTQYGDSELTIFDVIESDADMAEEIMAGVDEARAAAEGCEKMMTRLEALHQKIVDLKVPGVLEGWVLILAEKAVSVKAKAEALAEKLPAASEAIRTAGENAERRHKPLADAVRDAGHTAPAERDYHVE